MTGGRGSFGGLACSEMAPALVASFPPLALCVQHMRQEAWNLKTMFMSGQAGLVVMAACCMTARGGQHGSQYQTL